MAIGSSVKDELIKQYHDFRTMNPELIERYPDDVRQFGDRIGYSGDFAELKAWVLGMIQLCRSSSSQQFYRFVTAGENDGAIAANLGAQREALNACLVEYFKAALDGTVVLGRSIHRGL